MLNIEDIPKYNPPYDSPIEDTFAREISKHWHKETNIEVQKSVHTLCGEFRLDFMITLKNGQRIGIECDGKEFHDKSRDYW